LSPPNFRNRLYCQSATELVFYFQSLGILVNIRAIIESLANHYQIDEASLWQVAYQQLTTQLATLALDEQRRIWLVEQLLEQPNYPYKTLLLPIAERGDEQHGSMPAGASFTTNPFYQISHQFSQ
jgi:siderophore synthetase component